MLSENPHSSSFLPSGNALSEEEFQLFRMLVYNECGINFRPEKKAFLQNRILQRMRATGTRSYYRYYKLITDDAYKAEFLEFLDALTINETSFFRNRPQLELFRTAILPELVSLKRVTGDFSLKIWSAGCSTGQEPYTVAMILHETILDLKGWKIHIHGSDLSLTAMEAAQKGIYPKEKLDGIDNDFVRKYFIQADGEFHVREDLKKLVIFDFHNLMHDNGFSDIDVIFCRNVFIYFDAETQKQVIDRFYHALAPKGYLFLGHTESLHGLNDNFTFIHKNKGTAYQKK